MYFRFMEDRLEAEADFISKYQHWTKTANAAFAKQTKKVPLVVFLLLSLVPAETPAYLLTH